MKKLVIYFITTLTTISVFAYDCKVGVLYYNLNRKDKIAYVTHNTKGEKNDYSGSITIPQTITYEGQLYNVTGIDYEAFSDNKDLLSVNLPNSITTIRHRAFSGCTNLTSITFPNSIKVIGEGVFWGCPNLSSPIYNSKCFAYLPRKYKGTYDIKEGITHIACDAFYYCRGLTSINIPSSVSSIGADAFCGCSNLSSINIPSSITRIEYGTFNGCSNLTSITIPNNISFIGNYAFGDCVSLTSITIPKAVTKIGDGAFENCFNIKEVYVFSKDIKFGINKGYYVFDGCRINDFYCAESVDLTQVGGVVINVHRLTDSELYYKNSFFEYAQEYIEKRINAWQVKGEYEKTEDWERRVNETTRKQKINEYLAIAKRNYLSEYSKKQSYSFCLCSYDPDNEVYLVKEPQLGNILVPVAISDARYIKANWDSKEIIPHYDIVDNEVIVTSIDFKFSNNKIYTYKSNQKITYAQTEIEYNFNPIDFSGGAMSSTSAQPRNQQTIEQKRIAIGKSAVDTNIPVTNTKNANTFVVIIANENYQSVAKVPFANNDGEILSQYCNKTLGIPTDNIHIYKDATYNNMRSAMAWLEAVCRSYDGTASVIFYYTGHGIPDESNKTAYLLPVDGDGKYVQSGIALDEVYGKFGAMPSKSVTILLDACFSGATRNGAMLASAKGVAIKVKKGTPLGNTVALTAAQGDETAGFYEEQGHGLFTYFLLKKLQDTKGDVTLEQLSNYITTEVKRRSAVQGKVQTPSVMAASAVTNSWRGWKLK